MDVGTILTTISDALTTVGKVREATKTFQNAELKTLIAELASQLSDAKLNVAELKDELVALKAENKSLKEKEILGKPTVHWGCYQFPDDGNLYCPACFDTKAKKHLTTRLDAHFRQCTVCKAKLGVG